MAANNPFALQPEMQNDMDDFKMPYRLYGKTDLEIMIDKYNKLHNRSYGVIVRCHPW